jgi:hypothetical protein
MNPPSMNIESIIFKSQDKDTDIGHGANVNELLNHVLDVPLVYQHHEHPLQWKHCNLL